MLCKYCRNIAHKYFILRQIQNDTEPLKLFSVRIRYDLHVPNKVHLTCVVPLLRSSPSIPFNLKESFKGNKLSQSAFSLIVCSSFTFSSNCSVFHLYDSSNGAKCNCEVDARLAKHRIIKRMREVL